MNEIKSKEKMNEMINKREINKIYFCNFSKMIMDL